MIKKSMKINIGIELSFEVRIRDSVRAAMWVFHVFEASRARKGQYQARSQSMNTLSLQRKWDESKAFATQMKSALLTVLTSSQYYRLREIASRTKNLLIALFLSS